jgi:hypothetical protein
MWSSIFDSAMRPVVIVLFDPASDGSPWPPSLRRCAIRRPCLGSGPAGYPLCEASPHDWLRERQDPQTDRDVLAGLELPMRGP